ncbi:MAG: hypothetical protein ACHP84_10495 [Caulobacterales bacterium]
MSRGRLLTGPPAGWGIGRSPPPGYGAIRILARRKRRGFSWLWALLGALAAIAGALVLLVR